MQFLRLELEGIGPFAGHEVVDLQELGRGGLFLLEGPTGAGKTTLIDAIVFALYGDVSGVDSSKGRLVSTKLPAGVEPFVDLTIETSAGLYRVRRVPQYERIKARGRGTTVGKASIQLWKLTSPDDPGTQLSTSMQDANEELRRAIGLSKEQFTQTVVLPQGDFAQFLRAKPEDRRAILQQIFGTEFYQRVAERLVDMASEFRRREADARAHLQQVAAGFAAVAWPDADARAPFLRAADEASALAEGPTLSERADGRLAELRLLEVDAEGAASAAHDVAASAHDAHAAVVERNTRIAERRTLLARQAELEAAAGVARAQASELAAANRAERVRAAMTAADAAQERLEAARAEQARALRAIEGDADADLLDPALSAEELDEVSARAREQRSALTELVEIESGLGSRARQAEVDARRAEQEASDIERERALAGDDRAAAAELGPALSETLALASERADRLAARVVAASRVEAVTRLATLSSDFQAALQAERAAERSERVASEAHRAGRLSWIGGLAGTLASELTPDAPCPVCGSTTHPRPATLPDGAVTREDVERLERDARAAGESLAARRARLDAAATALSDQQAEVGDVSAIEVQRAFEEADARLQQAEASGRRAEELRRRIETLTLGAAAREQRLAEREKGLAVARERSAAASERLVNDRDRVAQAKGDHETLADLSSLLLRRSGHAKAIADALRRVQTGDAEASHRADELAVQLVETGFESLDAARAALRSEKERERLASGLQQREVALKTVAERLADERLAELVDAEPADEAPSLEASLVARQADETAQRHLGEVRSTLAGAAQASAEVEGGSRALETVRSQAQPYLAMADLAQGGPGNRASVTLPTFVLLKRFEEVVDMANARLDAMTGGRYTLRRTDAREGRSHKLGLGLEVVDHLTGDAARDPKTLSGGETFQASLALALGLADAVTAEAGGIELNTLFVDEGFGSLDPEALDMVMDQLTALRDAGRTVGVVSHVAEMKQRISDRVTVVRHQDGTSTLRSSIDAPLVALP